MNDLQEKRCIIVGRLYAVACVCVFIQWLRGPIELDPHILPPRTVLGNFDQFVIVPF